MINYTKGEWKVDKRIGCIAVYTQEQYDKANCSPCIGSADKYAIHFKHGFCGKDGWEIDPEDVANAQLIASAPDLYEALEEVEILLKDTDRDWAEAITLEHIQKALAKARENERPKN